MKPNASTRRFPRLPSGADKAVARDNAVLSRALHELEAGRAERAAALLAEHPEAGLTLDQVFMLYQSELETRTQQLEESLQRVEESVAW
ncbi:MAG: hypothetical protein RJA10_2581, partial [Pseudomonadota bacterium]